jgi:CcmD family protein
MNLLNDAATALYVAMFVALSVWIGIFIYLWRIDAQARALSRLLRDLPPAEQAAETPPPTTLTRQSAAERASITKSGEQS